MASFEDDLLAHKKELLVILTQFDKYISRKKKNIDEDVDAPTRKYLVKVLNSLREYIILYVEYQSKSPADYPVWITKDDVTMDFRMILSFMLDIKKLHDKLFFNAETLSHITIWERDLTSIMGHWAKFNCVMGNMARLKLEAIGLTPPKKPADEHTLVSAYTINFESADEKPKPKPKAKPKVKPKPKPKSKPTMEASGLSTIKEEPFSIPNGTDGVIAGSLPLASGLSSPTSSPPPQSPRLTTPPPYVRSPSGGGAVQLSSDDHKLELGAVLTPPKDAPHSPRSLETPNELGNVFDDETAYSDDFDDFSQIAVHSPSHKDYDAAMAAAAVLDDQPPASPLTLQVTLAGSAADAAKQEFLTIRKFMTVQKYFKQHTSTKSTPEILVLQSKNIVGGSAAVNKTGWIKKKISWEKVKIVEYTDVTDATDATLAPYKIQYLYSRVSGHVVSVVRPLTNTQKKNVQTLNEIKFFEFRSIDDLALGNMTSWLREHDYPAEGTITDIRSRIKYILDLFADSPYLLKKTLISLVGSTHSIPAKPTKQYLVQELVKVKVAAQAAQAAKMKKPVTMAVGKVAAAKVAKVATAVAADEYGTIQKFIKLRSSFKAAKSEKPEILVLKKKLIYDGNAAVGTVAWIKTKPNKKKKGIWEKVKIMEYTEDAEGATSASYTIQYLYSGVSGHTVASGVKTLDGIEFFEFTSIDDLNIANIKLWLGKYEYATSGTEVDMRSRIKYILDWFSQSRGSLLDALQRVRGGKQTVPGAINMKDLVSGLVIAMAKQEMAKVEAAKKREKKAAKAEAKAAKAEAKAEAKAAKAEAKAEAKAAKKREKAEKEAARAAKAAAKAGPAAAAGPVAAPTEEDILEFMNTLNELQYKQLKKYDSEKKVSNPLIARQDLAVGTEFWVPPQGTSSWEKVRVVDYVLHSEEERWVNSGGIDFEVNWTVRPIYPVSDDHSDWSLTNINYWWEGTDITKGGVFNPNGVEGTTELDAIKVKMKAPEVGKAAGELAEFREKWEAAAGAAKLAEAKAAAKAAKAAAKRAAKAAAAKLAEAEAAAAAEPAGMATRSSAGVTTRSQSSKSGVRSFSLRW